MATIEARVDKNLSRLEAQLKAWGNRLNEAAAKVNVAGKQAKAAGAEKWEALKEGADHIWHDLETTFKKLTH